MVTFVEPVAESDKDLVARCCSGDASAWEALVKRYSALVYSIPRRYRLPDAECDEVHQAVFAALVTGLSRLKDPKALPKWLMTSAHRESWRVSRARSRLVDTDREFVSTSTPQENLVEELEEVSAVRRALSELGGKCQRLLQLAFGSTGETDYQRVSKEMGIPMGSIGPTRQRCLALLATILRRMGIGPSDSSSAK